MGINFLGCKEDASVFHVTNNAWMWQGNASARHRQGLLCTCKRRRQGPLCTCKYKCIKALGKGLLSAVPLSCFHEVAAPPCYQHRSWEPVDALKVLRAVGLLIGVTPSSLLIRRTSLPRMWSRLSLSPLGMQLISSMRTNAYFRSRAQM